MYKRHAFKMSAVLFRWYCGLNVHFYADDTQLYMGFDPTDHEHTTSVLTQVENCINDRRIWMVENKLKRNADNTEVLILTPKIHSLYITDRDWRSSNCSYTNSTQSWSHVWLIIHHGRLFKHICKAAYFYLHNSSSIPKWSLINLPGQVYMLSTVAGWVTAMPC